MGIEENLEKLNKELQREISEECQMFCIMVRIRKTLEHHNLKTRFPILNFYCNWVLHAKLDKTDFIKEIFIKDAFNPPKPDIEKIISILKFDQFLGEFKNFLKKFSLSFVVIENDKKSKKFIDIISDILINTPFVISFTSTHLIKFTLVKDLLGRGITCKLSILKK